LYGLFAFLLSLLYSRVRRATRVVEVLCELCSFLPNSPRDRGQSGRIDGDTAEIYVTGLDLIFEVLVLSFMLESSIKSLKTAKYLSLFTYS
jgi:hypothetical protein